MPKDIITVRVQTKAGVWRLGNVPISSSMLQIKERILAEHSVPIEQQKICADYKAQEEIPDSKTLKQLNARNGYKFFFFSDAEIGAAGGPGLRHQLDKKGNVVLKPEEAQKRGFRPGLLPLSQIKRSWRVTEMDALDAQYTYEFKEPVKLECDTCLMESNAADIFTTNVKLTKFKPRVGFLYGTYDFSKKTTIVHTIYEPPQKLGEFGDIEILSEALDVQKRVDAVVKGLNLQKVGCIFCHEFRDLKFDLSSIEVLFAAEQQLESCDGETEAKPNQFVTVVVRENEDGNADFQAFQITRQCMEMVAKGMLLWGMDDPYQCDIHETFTALTVKHNKEKTQVLKNEDKSVPVEFLVQNVALKSHRCNYLDPLDFPIANRPGTSTGMPILSHYFRSHSRQSWGQKLADFQVLVALGQIYNAEDIQQICAFVQSQGNIPLSEGYKMVMEHM